MDIYYIASTNKFKEDKMEYFEDEYFSDREEEKDKKITPVYFVKSGEDWRINPVYSIEDVKNTPKRYVITSLLQGGKYVVSGMLYYKYRGIQIYTDVKNMIFVDTTTHSIWVRDYSKVISEISPIDPEERQYVILLYNEFDEDVPPEWVSLIGRTETYHWIRTHIELMDPDKSLILTENVALKDAITVYRFVSHLKNNGIIDDEDGFDIDEYRYEEI